jgi:hypothetical protein
MVTQKDASNSWERIMNSFDSAASDAHLSVGSAVAKNEHVNLRDQFSLAEYNNLRMEILKMIELQSQLLNIIVVAFGAVVTVGLQTRNAAIIAIHPILALILGICWLNHNYAIIRAADYIRSRLESRFYKNEREGWEHYILDYKISHARIGRLGERAIFSGSSLVAVLAAFYVGANNLWGIVAVITVTVFTVATILFFLLYREGGLTPSARLREARNGDHSSASYHK